MRIYLPSSNRGVSLIELLIAFVIGAMIIAGIYKVFIAQSKAYTVQDQVVEVQQSIRSAMEILLRDIRKAGYDSNQTPSKLFTAIFPGDSTTNTVKSDAITVQYRDKDKDGNLHLYTKVIYRDPNDAKLKAMLYQDGPPAPGYDPLNPPVLLDNVSGLTFTYGVDGRIDFPETQDGAIDDFNNDGVIDANDYIPAATVNGTNLNPIAVRVSLTANPSPTNADVKQMVQPRTLTSSITVRNLCLFKTN